MINGVENRERKEAGKDVGVSIILTTKTDDVYRKHHTTIGKECLEQENVDMFG